MPTINELIEGIVQERVRRLPKIQQQQAHLEKVLEKLNEVDGLKTVISQEHEAKQGAYYALLADNPEIEKTLSSINTTDLRKAIKKQKEKLDILDKRFGRNTIRIAMIGEERQGKSTFLRSISGLKSDKVIPAYDGGSCTGAVSVIHNIEGDFKVNIEFFELEDFLKTVKEKLKRFFPERTFHINSADDLHNLDLSGFSNPDQKIQKECRAFKSAYCEHVDEYWHLLGHPDIQLTNEEDVVKYVAQYDRTETPKEGFYPKPIEDQEGNTITVYQKDYYQYIAVKHVDIYKQFENIESRRIELVDTVGLGDTTNLDAIEDAMFEVLRKDCDVAVDIYRPEALAETIKEKQFDILNKIMVNLADRNPEKWIVYVFNKVSSGKGINASKVGPLLQEYEELSWPTAWAKIIDGMDDEDVKQNLIIPLLNLITQNLGELDDNLMEDANKKGEEIFGQFFKLSESMEKVISGAVLKNANEGTLFDEKVKDLFQNKETGLYHALGLLDDEKYRKLRKTPRPEVNEKLNTIIDGLYGSLPDENEIVDELEQYRYTSRGIFENFCHKLRNNIFDQFETVTDDVITPLREAVKLEMATCMFNEGRLGRVRLIHYSINDGPSMEWLDCLLQEKITYERYPDLYSVLDYIRTYQFNVKDSVEYEVTKSISMIDPLNADDNEADGLSFAPYSGSEIGTIEERGKAIFQELFDRIAFLQSELRKNVSDFAKMPSQSFATRIQKFHFRLTQNEKVAKDLREFYRENRYAIWREDFENIEEQSLAFGNWNQLCADVSALCNKEMFV